VAAGGWRGGGEGGGAAWCVWRVWRWGGEGRMGVVERSRRAVTVENTKRCVPSRLHLRPASRSTHYPTPRGRPMPAGCQWDVGAVAAGFFVVCDTSWWWWWFFKRPCRECVCELRQQAIFLCDCFALSLMEWRPPKKERGGGVFVRSGRVLSYSTVPGRKT
jgi:hypothetical protein